MFENIFKTWRLFLFRLRINIYPPYAGAGIRVHHIAPDFTTFDISMKLSFYNKNYFGTQFGGSLYSMCDPFFVFILVQNLGRGYIVWDKQSLIQFMKPGRGTVHAHVHIPLEKIRELKQLADEKGKVEPVLPIDLKDDDSNVIAHVEKTLYIRRKNPS